MRFELTIGFPLYALSRGAPSTTRPPLRLVLSFQASGLPTGIWGRRKPEAPAVAKALNCAQIKGLGRAGVSSRWRSGRVRPRYIKRGLALTPVKFGISFTATHLNQAGALVHVYSDGSM